MTYKQYYYRYEVERLPACRLVFHYLLHLAHCIRLHGPPLGYWSYVMERFVRLLSPLVHSRINPYSNLANSALLQEQYREILYMYEGFDLPFSAADNPSDKYDEKLGLLGVGKPIRLSTYTSQQVLRAGYEKILSKNDDSSRVSISFL